MAHYTGYVSIPHSTYDEWKSSVLGNSYDADNYAGAQCWDLAAEFWYNVGFPQNYPLTGGNDARGVWQNREANKGDKFDLIYNLSDVQIGDVVCFSGGDFGHIAFANQTYNGSGYLELLGQNQGGGTPAPGGGTTASINNYGVSSFQGAFRYKGWHTTPPTPPSPERRGKFPWVLYARKLRERR